MAEIFLPIVKKGKMDEFKRVWGEWLVLSNTVEEQKFPGRLKKEFLTQNGQMICLAPKSYSAYCYDTNTVKDGRKGIPNWAKLSIDDFHQSLYKRDVARHLTEVRSLRLGKDKKMTRTTMVKSGLTAIHVKVAVQEDKITCRPLKIGENYL